MKILVLHDTPTDFRDFLDEHLPHDDIAWATCEAEVKPALQQHLPEVIFSIKHSEFPGEVHRPAIEFPSVKWFHVGGSGTEHLGDWGELKVTNSAGVLAPFHAERALAGLLHLSTGLNRAVRDQANRVWRPTRFETLQGKTVLIVGMGATGAALAKLAESLGMRIIGVRRTKTDTCHSMQELPVLWPEADVVSLNLPLNDSTRHLMSRDVFSRLKPECLLLNAARGGVVCQDALLEALNEGHLGGAWLDVTEPEPLPKESPLWKHEKVLITAHCADQVAEFPLRFARFFVENLGRYKTGEELLNSL